jgi:hypothetical protein
VQLYCLFTSLVIQFKVVFAALQVAKLLIIPFVCAVEFLHPQIQRRFSTASVMCIATVAAGVAVV